MPAAICFNTPQAVRFCRGALLKTSQAKPLRYKTIRRLLLSIIQVNIVEGGSLPCPPFPPIESWQEELSRGRSRGGMISWGIHASFNYYNLRSGSEIIPPLVYASKYDPAQLYHPSYQTVLSTSVYLITSQTVQFVREYK